MTIRFSNVAPSEELLLTFDFTDGLAVGETLFGNPTIVVDVDLGVDPHPSGIADAGQVIGKTVVVGVSNLVLNTDYRITVTIATSNANKVLAVAGVLPVRRA